MLTRYHAIVHLASTTLLVVTGCATAPISHDATQLQALSLLMPKRIEIVEPFTNVKSFDDNATPDGIELLLQAVNSLDNPGQMIVGNMRFELYEYVPASGDRRGRRLEYWDLALATAESQRDHWNQVTQMYEFRLRVDPAVLPIEDRYVLAVTYNSPLGDRLSTDCLIEYRKPSGPLGQR